KGMKHSIILLLLLAMMGPATAQTTDQPAAAAIQWMTWEEAVAASAKEPKPVFIDLYTSWCHWCHRMDETTFQHPVIANYMNQAFYAVKMDAEMKDTIVFRGKTFVNPNPERRRNTHQLAASLVDGKMSYPSFVVLDGDFNRLDIIPGYRKAKELEPMLKFFGDKAYATTPYAQYMKEFQGDVQ
ncbi:MAG: DUF255 domain-containing protein, partial [Bacteroidota bacterium]